MPQQELPRDGQAKTHADARSLPNISTDGPNMLGLKLAVQSRGSRSGSPPGQHGGHREAAWVSENAPLRVELIHGVEVGGCLLLALAAGQEIDACRQDACCLFQLTLLTDAHFLHAASHAHALNYSDPTRKLLCRKLAVFWSLHNARHRRSASCSRTDLLKYMWTGLNPSQL